MSIHKFGYEMIKKKGQYWVNENNEKMLSHDLEYKLICLTL